MMTRTALGMLLLASTIGISACKLVDTTESDQNTIPADASGDEARTEMLLENTFESQLLPFIRDNALSIADLRQSVAQGGLDASGETSGTRGQGISSPWNFAVMGEGIVVETNFDTRARTIGLDTDGDGGADVTLQLGPVIRGTALRDVAPFYDFDDFRDQIEFARLGRAINNRIIDMIAVSEESMEGSSVEFVGVVSLGSANDAYLVTPVVVEVQPQ